MKTHSFEMVLPPEDPDKPQRKFANGEVVMLFHERVTVRYAQYNALRGWQYTLHGGAGQVIGDWPGDTLMPEGCILPASAVDRLAALVEPGRGR